MAHNKSVAERLINRAMNKYEICLVPVIFWRDSEDGEYSVRCYRKYQNSTCLFHTYPIGPQHNMDQAVLHAYKYMINNHWHK